MVECVFEKRMKEKIIFLSITHTLTDLSKGQECIEMFLVI